MSITTMSKFYYGHNITSSNSKLDFKEGSGSQLTATLDVGDFSLTEFGVELARALNAAGALEYTVSIVRATRIITIAATDTITLLAATGTNIANGVWSLAGFTSTDVTGASLAGTSVSGSAFLPQFKIQKYISFDDQESSAYSSVNSSASGVVEVVSFGVRNFCNAEIAYQTNLTQAVGGPIENQVSGLDNLRTFMQYITAKRKIEFIPDRDTNLFTKCLLESTPSSNDGTGFVLNEYLGTLPGFFSTGVLRFRSLT